MKKILLSVFVLFILGTLTASAANVSVYMMYDTVANILQPIPNANTATVKAANFLASSTATSSFSNASTTNLKISSLIDSTGSRGTVGMVLQTTGTVNNWVSTSSLNITGGAYLGTTSTWTIGNLARVASNGTVDSLATSTLGIFLSDTKGVLGVAKGGTAIGSYTLGDILYASGAATLTKLGIGANSAVLSVAGGIPSWNAPQWLIETGGVRTATSTDYAQAAYFVASSTTGTSTLAGALGIATTTPTSLLTVAGGLRLTGALTDSNFSAGASGTVLMSTNAGTTWVATSTLNTVQSGTAGQIPYYAAAGTTLTPTSTISVGSAGTVAINGASTNAALNVKVFGATSQAFQTQLTNTTDLAFSTYDTGDAFTRFSFLGDGTMKWGAGAFSSDVGIGRTASGTLSFAPYGSANSILVGIGSSTPSFALSVTGTTSTDYLKVSSQTASQALFLDANKFVVATGTSAALLNALTDETGSGVAVFGTSPAITTSITTPSTSFTAWAGATTLLTIGGSGASASLFVPSTLDTSSAVTGAIRTSGGISAAKALNIGTNGIFGGTLSVVSGTSTFATTTAASSSVLTLNVGGASTHNGASTFGNTVGITGAATLSSTLSVAATSSLATTTVATTTGAWPLTVYANNISQLALSTGGSFPNWTFANESGSLYFSTTTATGNATSSPSALAIMSTGSGLLVGTTTTTATGLAVEGTAYMHGLTGSAGLQTGIVCLDAASQLINESVACVASAERFKKDIQTLNVGLDELMRLRPVSFKWKEDYNGSYQNNPNYSGIQYSLIADEVQRIDPKLVNVTTAETSFEGKTYAAGTVSGLADTNHWVALLVKSIQDQQAEIQSLSGKATHNATDNWQWYVIAVLVLWLTYQQYQISKLKYER